MTRLLSQVRMPVLLAVTIAVAGSTALGAQPRSLSFDQRIECERSVAEVRWSLTAWPSDNPSPKPDFSVAVPAEVLHDRVVRQMVETALLARTWGVILTARDLDAELSRMARDTRSPETLRRLFAALQDDPFLARECLARPTLTRRLVEERYARDPDIHAGVRQRALSARAANGDTIALTPAFAERCELMVVVGDPMADRVQSDKQATLTADEWRRFLARLAARFGVTTPSERAPSIADLPVGRFTVLDEDDTGFVSQGIILRRHDAIRLVTLRWPKLALSDWIASLSRTVDLDSLIPESGSDEANVSLPTITGTGCTGDDSWTPTRRWFPDRRTGASTVWTGSQMIIWGGEDSEGGFHADGLAYDPSVDTWSAVPAGMNAPSPRAHHAVVWTGSEMIVWGGEQGLDPGLNSGGRYNPATGIWLPISTGANVPAPRRSATAVWTGSEMIVWGGAKTFASRDTDYFSDGARYEPATDTWTPLPPLFGAQREGHGAIWTGTEMIVWGGYTKNNVSVGLYLNSGYRFNLAGNSWSPTSLVGAPAGRIAPAIWTGVKMIVWGGYGVFVGDHTNSGGQYSPSSDTWTPTSTAPGVPSPRGGNAVAWTGQEMLVWGGEINGHGSDPPAVGTGGRYDPLTDAWQPISTGSGAPTERTVGSYVWTGTEMIVWGGSSLYSDLNSGGTPLRSGGRYNPSSDSWRPMSIGQPVPEGREDHTAIWTGTEMIIWGGFNTNAAEGLFRASHYGDGYGYDPAIDTWRRLSDSGAPVPRRNHSAVWSGTEMIVWGGQSGYNEKRALGDGARYRPATGTWAATSSLGAPVLRANHRAVWTGSQMIVWGGFRWLSDSGCPAPLNSGGRYDPALDRWFATSTGAGTPQARGNHTLVWTGSEMIVWGGRSGSFFCGGVLAGGARFRPDTNSWSATATGGEPDARDYHSAIWTGTEMVIWGGEGDSLFGLNTGGRYSPGANSWAPTSVGADVPLGRYRHTAIWAGADDGRMIVGGGVSGSPTYTSRGGAYCLCGGRTWHRDQDGDGFGNAMSTATGCTAPPGFVANGSDCNDNAGSVWARPGETQSLIVAGDRITIQWAPPIAPGGSTVQYDLVRSNAPSDFVNGAVCVASGSSAASAVDTTMPNTSGVLHYLSRANNACPQGRGPLGSNSNGQEQPGRACP